MTKTYTVTAAVAVVTDDAGKIRYYYQGAVLPSDLPAGELERLTDAGLLSTSEVILVAVDPASAGSNAGLDDTDVDGPTAADVPVDVLAAEPRKADAPTGKPRR